MFFLVATIWNSLVAGVFLLIFWLIGLALSSGTFNVLMWTNEEMLPGVPFWVIWLVMVNILGWAALWEDFSK